MNVEVIGVYAIDAPEPCHLIECRLRGGTTDLDIGDFTQDAEGQAREDRQAPWDEHILNQDGTAGQPFSEVDILPADARIAFFFHYLDLARPLLTPGGPRPLPIPAPLPTRLAFIRYEAP